MHLVLQCNDLQTFFMLKDLTEIDIFFLLKTGKIFSKPRTKTTKKTFQLRNCNKLRRNKREILISIKPNTMSQIKKKTEDLKESH